MCEREGGIERDNEGLGVSSGERTNLETPEMREGGSVSMLKLQRTDLSEHFLHKV